MGPVQRQRRPRDRAGQKARAERGGGAAGRRGRGGAARGGTAALWIAAATALGAGCAAELDVGSASLGVTAHCEAEVRGTGVVDVEYDYLPQVIACENGAAGLAALEAQAVAARTFLYYKLGREGAIGDGQGDQVYTCGNRAGEVHQQAVENTSGEILRYQGVVIAAFYVAGALQSGPDCTGGTDDPTGTERYVTYNQGKSGVDVEQTNLGWVGPANLENRGCKSQNGAHCLSDQGWEYDSILRFYYGEDIERVKAEGPCVLGGDGDDGDGSGSEGDDVGG